MAHSIASCMTMLRYRPKRWMHRRECPNIEAAFGGPHVTDWIVSCGMFIFRSWMWGIGSTFLTWGHTPPPRVLISMALHHRKKSICTMMTIRLTYVQVHVHDFFKKIKRDLRLSTGVVSSSMVLRVHNLVQLNRPCSETRSTILQIKFPHAYKHFVTFNGTIGNILLKSFVPCH